MHERQGWGVMISGLNYTPASHKTLITNATAACPGKSPLLQLEVTLRLAPALPTDGHSVPSLHFGT